MKKRSRYIVYLNSHLYRKEFTYLDTEEEAIEFCEFYDWCWYDENNFCWDLDWEKEIV